MEQGILSQPTIYHPANVVNLCSKNFLVTGSNTPTSTEDITHLSTELTHNSTEFEYADNILSPDLTTRFSEERTHSYKLRNREA